MVVVAVGWALKDIEEEVDLCGRRRWVGGYKRFTQEWTVTDEPHSLAHAPPGRLPPRYLRTEKGPGRTFSSPHPFHPIPATKVMSSWVPWNSAAPGSGNVYSSSSSSSCLAWGRKILTTVRAEYYEWWVVVVLGNELLTGSLAGCPGRKLKESRDATERVSEMRGISSK